MNPLVSVMMPARNTDLYIGQAIQSILNQTYDNWELILVDDKSTDKTREIAESYAKKDSRIKIFDGDGIGVAHTRNQIIDLSIGKYIMLQDSDDVSEPSRIELLLQEAEKHDKSYICSNFYQVNLDLSSKKEVKLPMSNSDIRAGFKRFYNRGTVSPNTSFAHRSLYEKNRYHEFIKIMSDWDLVLRIKEDPDVYFYNIQEPLYSYRLNDGSLTLKRSERIPYNLLVRYNEILRNKNKAELTSLAQFYAVINSNIFSRVIYSVFFGLKQIQHRLNFRK